MLGLTLIKELLGRNTADGLIGRTHVVASVSLFLCIDGPAWEAEKRRDKTLYWIPISMFSEGPSHRGAQLMMMDPASDLLPPPSSPTISSISSSDLDTESTGSFFHDRSTTLGTLMGVTFRAPSQRRDNHLPAAAPSSSAASRKQKKKRMSFVAERRRRWWSLCRDDEAKPGSLGEFLEVERRFGDDAFFGGAAELEVAVAHQQRNGRSLFADGRVLPPAEVDDGGSAAAGAICRFPVLLTGICSGCAG